MTGDHKAFKIHVKWDPATLNDKQVGRTIEYSQAAQVAWSKSHQMHPIWTMQKNSISQALFFEKRILVQRK